MQAGTAPEEAGLRAGPNRCQAGPKPEAAGLEAGPGRGEGRASVTWGDAAIGTARDGDRAPAAHGCGGGHARESERRRGKDREIVELTLARKRGRGGRGGRMVSRRLRLAEAGARGGGVARPGESVPARSPRRESRGHRRGDDGGLSSHPGGRSRRGSTAGRSTCRGQARGKSRTQTMVPGFPARFVARG